jgi:hypothetical protein
MKINNDTAYLLYLKTVWKILTKPKIILPYDPVIMLTGIYPSELKTYAYTKTCI